MILDSSENSYLFTFSVVFNPYTYTPYKPLYKVIQGFEPTMEYVDRILPTIWSSYELISKNDITRFLEKQNFSISFIESVFSYIHEYKYCYISLSKREVSRLDYHLFKKLKNKF